MEDKQEMDIMHLFLDQQYLLQKIDLLRLLGKITYLDLIFCLWILVIHLSHLRHLLNKFLQFRMPMVLLQTHRQMVNQKLTGLKVV